MASGLNIAYLLGTVDGDARLQQQNGSPVSVFKLNTVEKNESNGKTYPIQFVIIMRGALATAKAAICTAGKRILVTGTHEEGRIFKDAEGNAARTNDFSASEVRDPLVDDLNEAFLFGNLGSDARLQGDAEKPFASTSLATNLYMGKDENGGSRQRTIWNALNLNGKQATGLADSLKKGVYIGVLAQYRYSKPYQDKTSGEQRISIQYNARNVVFGGSSYKGTGAAGAQSISSPDDLFAGLGNEPPGVTSRGAAPTDPAGVSEPAGSPDSLFDNF